MTVVTALLRGVNVGGSGRLPMATLRSLCESLGHQGAVTYIQSGNVVFRTRRRDLAAVATELTAAIGEAAGFCPGIAVRTLAEMEDVVARNPFAGRAGLDPARLLVTFLPADPGEAARQAVREIDVRPEELHALGAELYTYFQEGMGKTKLPFRQVDRALGCSGTARNWNTVLKLLEIARGMAVISTT